MQSLEQLLLQVLQLIPVMFPLAKAAILKHEENLSYTWGNHASIASKFHCNSLLPDKDTHLIEICEKATKDNACNVTSFVEFALSHKVLLFL